MLRTKMPNDIRQFFTHINDDKNFIKNEWAYKT